MNDDGVVVIALTAVTNNIFDEATAKPPIFPVEQGMSRHQECRLMQTDAA